MSIWKNPEVIEKSKINSKNRCGGENAVAKGTHTGGSITIGEHHKRLAIKNGRDPTPSEIHLHIHTHGHDEKSFVGERARIVHEKYQEILQNQTQTQSDVDQWQKYFMDQIFVSLLDLMLRAQYYVLMLKQHRQKMWMS